MHEDTYLSEQKQNQLNDRMYVNATDNEGNTALHLAVQNGFLEVRQKCFISK